MSATEGLRIISVAKTLEAYQSGDAKVSQYFGATRLAGRGGLLASSLRYHSRMTFEKFRVHASEAKIDGPSLKIVLPWLAESGFIEVDTARTTVDCNVIDYDAILKATLKFFQALDPTPEERAVLVLLDLAVRLPTARATVFDSAKVGSDKVVETALDLAVGYNVIRIVQGDGVAEPILYSPTIWGANIAKSGKALSHMDANERALLLELISRVTKYQGMPEIAATNWLSTQGKPLLLQFAVSVGLLDRTEILTKEGNRQAFLTTPHLYGEIAATHGRDVCDRVRLFLDSIRHGQHYGEWVTGKISDPVLLLTRLLDKREIGPCTAIGYDYILVEKAGIVTVEPHKFKSNQFVMKLVQDDTVQVIRDMLEQPHGLSGLGIFSQVGPSGQHQFVSSEQARPQIGQLPGAMKRAEEQMLRNLRELS
jgi:hypothetical protein